MPLRVKCPTGHTLIVPDDRAGRTLRCPRCGENVVVPGEVAGGVRESVVGFQESGVGSRESAETAATAAAVVLSTIEPADEVAPLANPPSQPVATPLPVATPPPIVKPKSRVIQKPPAPPRPTSQPPELPAAPIIVEPLAATAPLVVVAATALPEPSQVIAELDSLVELPVTPASPEAPPAESEVAPSAAAPLPAASEREPGLFDFLHSGSVNHGPAPPPAIVSQPVASAQLHGDAGRTLAVYQLAAALVAAAVFSVAPAVWDVVDYLRAVELDTFVARWALVLFFVGIVQLAYAVYLFQLPDWATVWVVTVFLLLLAAGYAGVLGLVLVSGSDGFFVGPHGLQLADKLAGGQAALWCLCMVSVATILAFFAGRMSVKWQRAERLLRVAGY